MRLLDRVLRRDDGYWEGVASGAALITETYGMPDREPILPVIGQVTRQQYGMSGVVFSAIQARLALFCEITFKLQSLADKRLIGNQSLSILEHPFGPYSSTAELLARMEQDVSLVGNSFTWDAGDRLVRLRPDWVTIISEIRRDPLGRPYRVPIGYGFDPPEAAQPDFGGPELFTASEVAHWAPIPDPWANFRGMSWLTPVAREIQGDIGMTGYKIKYLEHAATPNLLLKYAQKLQPATIDALRDRITARYGGVSNAFKTLVLDQGADATVVGANLQQMDFSSVQQAGADRVLAASSVPQVLVGLEPLRGAGRSYEETVAKFGNLWARPQWRSVCGALAKLVPGLPPQGLRLWYDDSDIAALQDSVPVQAQSNLVRAQATLTLVQAGYERESVVNAVETGDFTQLKPDPAAAAAQARQTQHLLPQPPGSGPVAAPLPEGNTPRLPVPAASPGDGGNLTQPGRRPASVRRGANGHG